MIFSHLVSPKSGKIHVPDKNLIIGDKYGIGQFSETIDLSMLPLLRESAIIIGSKKGNVSSKILIDLRYDINFLKKQVFKIINKNIFSECNNEFDIAKTGRNLQEEVTGFDTTTNSLTDIVVTYAVLSKTQVLIGKNKDGTDDPDYDKPISGYGLLSPPLLDTKKFKNWIDYFYQGVQSIPKLTIDFKPKKSVSFENQGIDSLSYVNFSKETSDLKDAVTGTVAKNGDTLSMKTNSGWKDIGHQPLQYWTTATRPTNDKVGFGVNQAVR